MSFPMRVECKVIDICLVKYTPTDRCEEQFSKIVNFFSDDSRFNVLIHDNNIENIGLVKARNILLKKSNADYICFLDFDIEIKHICWDDIIEKFESTEDVAIISPVTTRFSTVDNNVRWQPKEYLACNFMIFKKSTFERIGTFDEAFFVAYGDWDIVKRCMDNKLLLLQDNKSYIDHYGFSKENPEKGKLWRKDFATFVSKHGADATLDRTMK